jgi:hypothetical protein
VTIKDDAGQKLAYVYFEEEPESLIDFFCVTRSHPGRFPLVASARHVMPPEQISAIKLPCDLPLALTASGPVGRPARLVLHGRS